MIIQKLRLQHGWSQQQLADMSGLSTRTIQRIESGHTPSVESIKSLAAVFEVDFSTLQGALTMNTETISATPSTDSSTNLHVTEAEKKAFKHVRKLKRFYKDLCIFAVVITFLFIINWLTSPDYWWAVWVLLGWGLSFVIRAVGLFLNVPFFDADWEKRQIDNYLKRKP